MSKNVYILNWYGPFENPDKVKEWETNKMGKGKTYLYLFRGKKKGARKYSYYCGQAYDQTSGERMSNKGHHIEEVIERPEHLAIWVAKFDNLTPKKSDVNNAEKLLTSVMAQVEITDEKAVLNKINKHHPKELIYMINEWFYESGEPVYQFRQGTMCNLIHDVIICYPQKDCSSIFGNKKIHFIQDIK